jgi:hypothetical protein
MCFQENMLQSFWKALRSIKSDKALSYLIQAVWEPLRSIERVKALPTACGLSE